jgi:hypothetical protein
LKKVHFSTYFLSLVFGLFIAGTAIAEEHPGSAVEHPETAVKKQGQIITADFVKKSIQEYVDMTSAEQGGVFEIKDPELNKTWKLKLAKIHDPVRQFEADRRRHPHRWPRKEGRMFYFTCSDFKSVDSDDVLDVDFWMVPADHTLKVIVTNIHKLNGKPRYTYEGVEIEPVK